MHSLQMIIQKRKFIFLKADAFKQGELRHEGKIIRKEEYRYLLKIVFATESSFDPSSYLEYRGI